MVVFQVFLFSVFFSSFLCINFLLVLCSISCHPIASCQLTSRLALGGGALLTDLTSHFFGPPLFHQVVGPAVQCGAYKRPGAVCAAISVVITCLTDERRVPLKLMLSFLTCCSDSP